MRLPLERRENPLELMQSGAGQTDRFTPAIDQKYAREAPGVDDHHVTVVSADRRCRTSRKTGIRCLHDDDLPFLDARCKDSP
jgi:hypothetical protein